MSSIAFFVVLFPALDVASAFPLNGITLGNCLMGKYYGKNIREHSKSRRKVTAFRCIAAIPPIIGAMFVRRLDTITEYTGLTGFLIAFVFPGLLHVASRRACKREGLDTVTEYGNKATRAGWVAPTIVCFGFFLLAFVFCNLVGRDIFGG